TQIANGRTAEYVQKIALDRIIVLAITDDKIVGMGALKGNEIRHMYVQSEYQGKGIGSKLIDFIAEEAYFKGLSSIIVNSVDHSEEFYIKNGFKPLIKNQIWRHGVTLDAILLEKFLE
ncbi:MAG: GNAT family N-acetyltransferase, partial [Candidatus Heimdallarchaeota archaeon]